MFECVQHTIHPFQSLQVEYRPLCFQYICDSVAVGHNSEKAIWNRNLLLFEVKNMAAERPKMCIISCSVLKRELKLLKEQGKLYAELVFVSKNFHVDYGLLENLSLIHISEPTRLGMISYAVFCLK